MKIILLFVGLIFCMILDAQNYKVVSRSALNVREAPGTQAGVIGKLSPGDTVYVKSVANQWAQLDYNNQTGYVSKKYILPLQFRTENSAEAYFQGMANLFKQGPLSYLPLLILLTFFLTLILRKIFVNYDAAATTIGFIGLTATCIMELFYFINYNVGIPWFCYPGNVKWIWIIINFLLYGFILLRQLRLGFEVIAELCQDSTFNLKTGVYSYPIAIILLIIFSIADIDMGAYIIAGLLLAQMIQIIINFYLIRPWGNALLVSFLFLLNSVAIICSSVYFIAMLIFVVLTILTLSFIGSTKVVYVEEYH